MDLVMSFSDNSEDSFCSKSLEDVVQETCQRLENEENYSVQSSLRVPAYQSVLESAIHVLSQKKLSDSNFTNKFKVVCHGTSDCCTNIVKKQCISSNLHRPWDIGPAIPVRSFCAEASSVPVLSKIQCLQVPPTAHKSMFPSTHVDTELSESTRKRQKHHKNYSFTQSEPLDLTTKNCGQTDDLLCAQGNITQTDKDLNVSSGECGQLRIGQNNIDDEQQSVMIPSTLNESASLSINSLYEDQATEYKIIYFSPSGKKTKDNSDVTCCYHDSGTMQSLSFDDSKNKPTAKDNLENIRPPQASDKIETHGTLQTGHILISDAASNSNSIPNVSEYSVESCGLESDTESMKSPPSYGVNRTKYCSMPGSREEVKVFGEKPHAAKSLKSGENSSEKLNDTFIIIQNPLHCPSGEMQLGRNLSNKFHGNSENGSKCLPTECDLGHTHKLLLNESVKSHKNMVINSLSNIKMHCKQDCLSMPTICENVEIITSDADSKVSVCNEEDTECYSTDVSKAQLSVLDSHFEESLNKQENLHKTDHVSLDTWSIKNMADIHSSTSLKITLCRTSASISKSSQPTTDNVEAEVGSIKYSSSGRLDLALDARVIEGCSDCEVPTVVKQQSILTEKEEDISTCMSYSSTPEISCSKSTVSNYSKQNITQKKAYTDTAAQMSSTPLLAKTEKLHQNTLKSVDTDNKRSRQTPSQNKDYQCQSADSVLNMGFSVAKDEKYKTYITHASNKKIQSSSSRCIKSDATSKTHKTTSFSVGKSRKKTFLQSLKHKFFCRKSNVSPSLQDTSTRAKFVDDFADGTTQQQVRAKGIPHQASSCKKDVTYSDTFHANRGKMPQNPDLQSAEPILSTQGGSSLFYSNSESETKFQNFSHKVHMLKDVGAPKSIQLIMKKPGVKWVQLQSQDHYTETAMHKDLSSPQRKSRLTNNEIYSGPTIHNSNRLSVIETKAPKTPKVEN